MKGRLFSETRRHPKIVKNGIEHNVYTLVLHLAPGNLSGYEVCPMRSAGCTASCLHTAGYQHTRKYAARLMRTKLFFENRSEFMERLSKEITTAKRYAEKHGYLFGVRLNGTSDITWENVRGGDNATVFDGHRDVAFYDYTKRYNRKDIPENYRLVFSRSENNFQECVRALSNGMNVAVVFDTHKKGNLPKFWQGYQVIDGDESDWRYDDPRPCIVGLRAKGKAIHDTSGFVVRTQK